MTLWRNLRLSALVDFQGGMVYEDGEIQAGHQNFQNTAAAARRDDPIFAAYQSLVPRAPLGFFDAGFSKLRELSAGYNVPASIVRRVGLSNALGDRSLAQRRLCLAGAEGDRGTVAVRLRNAYAGRRSWARATRP
ncbi:MAG: hypothetical protein IPN16_20615 [Gemmatimonadetes bacterium]|nr:hypothetical protein [Gemmatimonadota bacterium]